MAAGSNSFRRRLAARKLILLFCGLVALGAVGTPVLRTEYALWQARRALKSRHAEEALRYLQTAQRLDPDRAETQFLLARAFRRLGRMDDVRTHLAQAAVYGAAQDLLDREQWLALAQSGQLTQAEPHLAKLLGDPRDDGPEICEAYVNGYITTLRLDRAQPLLVAWSAEFPRDPRPHVYWGLFHEHSDEWSQAADAFRKALSLAPDDADSRFRLAGVLMEMHKYGKATELLRVCLQHQPGNLDVLCRWGRCLQNQGQTDAARSVLTEVLGRDPRHYEARLEIGRLEYAAGDFEAAIRSLVPLCREAPTDAGARYALAQALEADGHQDAAKEHWAFVAEARREMQEVERMTGLVHVQPDDADLRYQIGTRLLKYDSPSHGAVWLRTVLELDPHHQPTHAALAEHYASIGSTELAEAHRRRAETETNSR